MSTTVLEFERHPNRKLHVWLFTDVSNAKSECPLRCRRCRISVQREIGDDILNRKLPRDYSFINALYVRLCEKSEKE